MDKWIVYSLPSSFCFLSPSSEQKAREDIIFLCWPHPWCKQCYFNFSPPSSGGPMDLSSPTHIAPPCWHLYWAPWASPVCTHHGTASLQPRWWWAIFKEWDANGRSTPSTSAPTSHCYTELEMPFKLCPAAMLLSLLYQTIHMVLDFSMQLIRESHASQGVEVFQRLGPTDSSHLLLSIFHFCTGLQFHYLPPFKSKASPLENGVILYYLPISKWLELRLKTPSSLISP